MKVDNKIIHYRDYGKYYERQEFDLIEPAQMSYAAGEFQSLIPKGARLRTDVDLRLEKPLFNKSKNAKIMEKVGKNGMFYLELQPRNILETLFSEPDCLVVDLYYGKDSLIYGFYNPSDSKTITITAKVGEDIQDVFSKLKANYSDIEYRQYFIRKALVKPGVEKFKVQAPIRELMNAEQVADYLQVKVKTIHNWKSEGKIPFAKLPTGSVRYKLSEIEKWIIGNKKSKK